MTSLRLPRPVPVQTIAALLTFGLLAAWLVPVSATANSVYTLAGDWTGDGKSAPGWYVDGVFHLQGAGPDGGDLRFAYGRPDDHPVVGDWNGNGIDTVGIVRDGRHWHLRKTNTAGPGDTVFTYGSRWRTERPVVGDWNGNGFDTVGVVRGNTWLLRNSLSGGEADLRFTFGRVDRGDWPLAADWNGDNRDTPGVVRDGAWYISDEFGGGSADRKFVYGRSSDAPIAGNWDGKGGDTPGVVRGSTWFLKNSLSGGVADTTSTFADKAQEGAVEVTATKPSQPLPAKPAPEPVDTQDSSRGGSDDAAEEKQPAPAPTPETEEKVDAEPKESDAKNDSDPIVNIQPAPSATGVAHGAELGRSDVGLPSDWRGTASGAVRSSHAGQVIEGLEVDVSSGAAILVQHDDVTVRFNRVSHRRGANGVVVASGVGGAVVEFNEFNGHYRTESGNSGSIGVVTYGAADISRNFFQGGRDGVHAYGANSRVIENWVDDLHKHPDAHNDAVQLGGRQGRSDIVIARNRVVAGHPGGIDLYPRNGPLQGVDIMDNLVIGVGKGFGIRGGRSPFHDHSQDNRDIRIEGNRFEGRFGWPHVLGEGTNAGVDLSRPGNTFTNNRWVDSTTDLLPRCGITQDRCD